MIIRQEQFEHLQEATEQATLERYGTRLRAEFAEQLRSLSEAELEAQLGEGCRAAKNLDIVAEEDIYRFLRLRYLTTGDFASETVRHAFYKIIGDVEVPAPRRLDFIERHILNRPRDGGQPKI